MTAGGVTVDVASVERALRREDGDIWVALRSPSGPEVDLALAEAVSEANEAQGEDGIFAELVSPTPQGAAAMVSIPDGRDVGAWLADLARSFDREAMAADSHRTNEWYVPPTASQRICDAVAQWGAAGGDEVVAGGSFKVALTTSVGVAEILATGVRLDGRSSAFWHHRKPRRARHVMLSPGGRGAAQVFPPELLWRDRVDALRELITALPDLTDLAFIRTSYSFASTWLQVDPALRFPHIQEMHVRDYPHVLDLWVPNAHGVQVLTNAHLERAHDLSAWSLTDLGHGRHLVEAPDLEPWYGGDRPDEATLAQARADFGEMILTPEIIEAHRLPPPPG